jgi:iron-sulfur cluster assembly protein
MIYVSDTAKSKVSSLLEDAHLSGNEYFLRVSVVSGGCSGLSYKMDFDNEKKPMDQEFEDNGIKVVTDLKSFLYLVNTTLEKDFILIILMPAGVVVAAKVLESDFFILIYRLRQVFI